VSGQLYDPDALYSRAKYPLYPFYRRLDVPPSPVWLQWLEENPLPVPGTETQLFSTYSDTVLTELFGSPKI
jgi:hypothetical protein